MPAKGSSNPPATASAKGAGVSFTVRVTEEQHKALEAIARLENLNLTELMRRVIADAIAVGLDPDRVAQKLKNQEEIFRKLQEALVAHN